MQKSDCGSNAFITAAVFSFAQKLGRNKNMAYAGRHNIYEATIRRMVNQALEAQEQEFAQFHEQDTPQQLLSYLQEQAAVLGHTPWPGEIVGGTVIEKRFGSWQRALLLAGLAEPKSPNKPGSFARVKEETERQKELYRQRKAEKKALSEKRRAEQEERRKRSQ